MPFSVKWKHLDIMIKLLKVPNPQKGCLRMLKLPKLFSAELQPKKSSSKPEKTVHTAVVTRSPYCGDANNRHLWSETVGGVFFKSAPFAVLWRCSAAGFLLGDKPEGWLREDAHHWKLLGYDNNPLKAVIALNEYSCLEFEILISLMKAASLSSSAWVISPRAVMSMNGQSDFRGWDSRDSVGSPTCNWRWAYWTWTVGCRRLEPDPIMQSNSLIMVLKSPERETCGRSRWGPSVPVTR